MSNNDMEIKKCELKIKEYIEQFINSNELKKAYHLIEEYEKVVNDDIEIVSMKAIIYIKENKLEDAEKILHCGMQINSSNFDILYNMAYLCELKDEKEKSIYYYKKATQLTDSEVMIAEITKIINRIKSENKLQNKKKKILIGSAIHQKPQILMEFLTSIAELNTEEFEVRYIFIDDNEILESSEMLIEFSRNKKNVFICKNNKISEYNCDEEKHSWNEELIWKVASFKNDIIDLAVECNYDYLFLVDSDLVIHPRTLEQLVDAEKDIISNIFWTKWNVSDDIELPQVWVSDQYTQYYKGRNEQITNEDIASREFEFINKLKMPGVYEVGGLGACTLINKKALMSGINFSEIKNISLFGEDRHFCVRAQALGFKLYVDTHYPSYHIYRESYLEGVCKYKKQYFIESSEKDDSVKVMYYKNNIRIAKVNNNKLTLSMIVKNEAGRYLEDMLKSICNSIDEAVIIDDFSTDNSVEIIMKVLKDIPVHVIRNSESKFSNEIFLRKQQWDETIKTNPDWILSLDADEIFEKGFDENIKCLINQVDYDVVCFRLYDFWDKNRYREDMFWNAHATYRPFLVRYQKNFEYTWRETAQHCGRLPMNILDLPYMGCKLRVKHFGWANEKDRIEKYKRYLKLDPEGEYGIKEQYESILDKSPNLVLWKD